MNAYLLVGNYRCGDDNEKWLDKDTLHEVWLYYSARVTPWSGPWPDLLPVLRSDYLTRMAWLTDITMGKTMRKAILNNWGQMQGIWMWASSVVVTSRKLMQEHAVAASAAPKMPDQFSPFASDRFMIEVLLSPPLYLSSYHHLSIIRLATMLAQATPAGRRGRVAMLAAVTLQHPAPKPLFPRGTSKPRAAATSFAKHGEKRSANPKDPALMATFMGVQ